MKKYGSCYISMRQSLFFNEFLLCQLVRYFQDILDRRALSIAICGHSPWLCSLFVGIFVLAISNPIRGVCTPDPSFYRTTFINRQIQLENQQHMHE